MRRVLGCLLMVSIGGCECLFPEEGGTGGGGGSGGTGGGGGQVMVHDQCASAFGEELDLAAAMTALKTPPIADGVQELKLSPSGCIVLRREFSGGRQTALSLRKFFGYATIVDGGIFDPVLGELESVWFDARFGADGKNHVTMDFDGNRKTDYTFDETWSGGRLAQRQTVWFDDSTGTVVRRTTLAPAAAGALSWKIEALRSGALAVVLDTTVPAAQNQTSSCYMPAPGADDVVPCPVDDATIRTKLHDALDAFSMCLTNLGVGTLRLVRLEIFLLAGDFVNTVDVKCFQANTYYGQMQLETNVLKINSGLLTCESPGYTSSTLVHELIHRVRGPHDFDAPAGPYGAKAQAGSDPSYACEQLCFGGMQTKCTCARCLGVKACDPVCDGLASCKTVDDAGTALSSEAVGAWCKGNNTWFMTMAACQSAGACPSNDCKSYSVSCDPTCQ